MLDNIELAFADTTTHRRRQQVVAHVREAVTALRVARRSLLIAATIPARPDTEADSGPAVDEWTQRLLAHWAQTAGTIAGRLDVGCAGVDALRGGQAVDEVQA